MSAAPSQRVVALDGLRGWAALSVVFFHLTWETFGQVMPVFRTLPFALFANGNFAVAVFLMISGYVLTIRGWRDDDKGPIRRQLVKRYFRLTIPIAASVFVFWLVMALGLAFSPAAGVVTHSPHWLQAFASFPPDFGAAMRFGFFDVYFHTGPRTYGPFLWTMAAELWGSYLVLLACLFERPGRWAYLPLVVLVMLGLFGRWAPFLPMAACYPAGALFALLVKDGHIRADAPDRTTSAAATVVAVGAIVVAAVAELHHYDLKVATLCAMVLVVATTRSAPLTHLLETPLSVWLGRLCFPLYLLQIVVIVWPTSAMILFAHGAGALNVWTALGIAAVSTALALIAAQVFMPVERFALRLTHSIDQWWAGLWEIVAGAQRQPH